MTIVKDYQGRPYMLLEIRAFSTILECLDTGARVTLTNREWDLYGFGQKISD